MNTTELLSRPLFSLTVGEFLELQKLQETPVKEEIVVSEKHVYGLQGIMQLFNCSRKTAQRIKNSGKINKAIKQCGRKIIIDAKMALELVSTDK